MVWQKNYLRHWAAENGYTVVGGTVEIGNSTQMDRPSLSEVVQAVQENGCPNGEKTGPLARFPLDDYRLMETLKEKAVDLICTDEKLTPDLFVARFLK